MTLTEAARILNLVHPVTEAEVVRAAFAVQVRANHPDTVVDGKAFHLKAFHPSPPPTMQQLKDARDVLLQDIATRPRPDCPACRGSGWVAEGFRKMRCPKGC